MSRAGVAALIAAASACAGGAMAQSSSRPFDAVVCTSEASVAWTLKARGTLTRTRSASDLLYKFESAEHAFEWRFTTSPQGNTTASGPGFLMDRFGMPPKQGESEPAARRQSLETTGEIRESAGPSALVLLIAAKCPSPRWTPQTKGREGRDAMVSSADIERARFYFECAGIGYVDLGADFDMPAYYFDARTRRIISACGGLCMHRMDACEKVCPPRAWVAAGCEAKKAQFRSSVPSPQRLE